MRRVSIFVSVLAVVPLGLVTLGRTGPATAQDTTPPADGQGFVGSWRVMVTPAQGPPGHAMGTFDANGTLVTSIVPVQPLPSAPGEVAFASAGNGAWVATGPDTAVLTFVVLLADGQGNLFGTNTVRSSIALGADGQTFSGEVVRTIADPDGTTVATIPGTVQATRIIAEAPEMPPPGTPGA